MNVMLSVRWVALPGEEERVAGILRRLAEASRAEPGCLQWDPARDVEDPRVFVLFERYVDDAAFAAHQASEHFKALVVKEALPLLEERVRTYLTPLA